MFLIELTYTQPIEAVERLLGEHRAFLERQYASGYFLLSGRKLPRTGGIILARAKDVAELEAILAQDPFHIGQVASYAITEFVPTMAAEQLAHLVSS
jgi:uncharacterized protein YciI